MDRWTQYLFQQHSKTELKEWASRLDMFRYFRAYGGHANDGDSLDIALRYESSEELVVLTNKLGLTLITYSNKPEQPVTGESYSSEEYSSFPSLIKDTEWIQQPGHCCIFGFNVFIWCGNGLVHISASPKSYVVTSKHIEVAEELEKHLGSLREFIVDPPKDTKHYICPKYHPSLFS